MAALGIRAPGGHVRVLAIVVLVLLAALAAFSLLNWSAIAAPAALSLGVTTLDAPLGVVLLGFVAALTGAFLVYAVSEQARSLSAARRFERELHAQRALADEAERSRFAELRAHLDTELRALRATGAGGGGGDLRLDELRASLLERIEESTNGLAAHLAELEDKLDRALGERRITPR
jgi:hypothetical protein